MSRGVGYLASRRDGVGSSRLGGLMLVALLPTALSPAVGSMPVAGVAAAALVLSYAGGAKAAAGDESPEVEALLRKGIQLRREGQDEAALAVFLEAEAQAPNSVRVLLHVATAAQAASKWLMADEYLHKAMSHEDDPYFVRYKAEIEEVRAATSQRVGHFRALGEPDGAEVILNGQVVGTLPMETPKTLEAGTYVLEVNKPGYYRLRRPVAVPGGVLTRETVQLNERTGNGPDPDPAGAASVPQEPKGWWASSWVTWTLGGVAVAAGATSGVSFYLRQREADHWNDNSRCLDANRATTPRSQICGVVRNHIDTAEQVGIITGVVGVAFAGAALTQWIASSGPSSSSVSEAAQRKERSHGSVQCSPGVLSVMCGGSF